MAAFACRADAIPIVSTYHGLHHGWRNLSIWGDRVICVSADAQAQLVREFGVPTERTCVIHNGIPLPCAEPLRSSAQSECVDHRQRRIIHVARLSPEKDQATLLTALAEVIVEFPNVVLTLVGSGPLAAALQMQVAALGLSSHVVFAGEVEDAAAFLADADLFVLSSLTEGMPLALLEAMSYALPVVVTSAGDIPAVVLDGDGGRVVPPGDARALARAVKWMLSHPAEASAMGQVGRAVVAERFSLDVMIARTEAVYESVLMSRRSRAR